MMDTTRSKIKTKGFRVDNESEQVGNIVASPIKGTLAHAMSGIITGWKILCKIAPFVLATVIIIREISNAIQ